MVREKRSSLFYDNMPEKIRPIAGSGVFLRFFRKNISSFSAVLAAWRLLKHSVEFKNNQNYQKNSCKGTDVFDCRLSEYKDDQAYSDDKQKSLPEKIDDLLGYAKLHKQRKRQPDGDASPHD